MSWAKKWTSSRRFPFFWASMITKQKFSIGNYVLPGEGKPLCIEGRLCQGVLFNIFFCVQKNIIFMCLLQFKELDGVYQLKSVSCLESLNFMFHLQSY